MKVMVRKVFKMQMDIYDSIKNPLDDPAILNKLISIYSYLKFSFNSELIFYDAIIHTVDKKDVGIVNVDDCNCFYSMIFNKWKDSMIIALENLVDSMEKDAKTNSQYLKTLMFLKFLSNITTVNEMYDVFRGVYNGQELDDDIKTVIRNNKWNNLGEGSEWVFVSSGEVSLNRWVPEIEHRLYIDTESINVYRIVLEFVKQCDMQGIPYYFKFDEMANRDDTIVIYSDQDNLINYVNILMKIKRIYPEINWLAPPMLTGVIDDFMGYGSEPIGLYETGSFNEKRAAVLYNSINDVNKKWILNHKDKYLKYRGKIISFKKFFSLKIIEYLNESAKMKVDSEKQVEGFLERNIDNLLAKYCDANYSNVVNGVVHLDSAFTVDLPDGDEIIFSSGDFVCVIRQMAEIIARVDPNFALEIKSEIKRNFRKNGIDSEKICFDVANVEHMREYDTLKEDKSYKASRKNINKAQMTRDKIFAMSLGITEKNYRVFAFHGMIIYGEAFLDDFINLQTREERQVLINDIENKWKEQVVIPLQGVGIIQDSYEQLVFNGIRVYGDNFVSMVVNAKDDTERQKILNGTRSKHQINKSKVVSSFTTLISDLSDVRLEDNPAQKL